MIQYHTVISMHLDIFLYAAWHPGSDIIAACDSVWLFALELWNFPRVCNPPGEGCDLNNLN